MKQLIDFFHDKKVKTLLDIGTGSGDFIKVLKEVFPKTLITGVDPNKTSLELAREKYTNVSFLAMGAEQLTFEDKSFDAASISMALHHLPDISKSFAEMKRVLKPGAWIIVSELFSDNLNPAQEVHKLYHHFRSSIDRVLAISHNKTFKKGEILQMVIDAGIDIQLHFEFESEHNPVLTEQDIQERVTKMYTMLDSIKGYLEYELLRPKIDEFQERVIKYGFQPATRVVIVGKF